MLLERTIAQLDVGWLPPEEATAKGHMGYLQWLGALHGDTSYPSEAMRAYQMAQPFIRTSPAVAVFCHLLVESTVSPALPLILVLPEPIRKGGAKARRGRG